MTPNLSEAQELGGRKLPELELLDVIFGKQRQRGVPPAVCAECRKWPHDHRDGRGCPPRWRTPTPDDWLDELDFTELASRAGAVRVLRRRRSWPIPGAAIQWHTWMVRNGPLGRWADSDSSWFEPESQWAPFHGEPVWSRIGFPQAS